MTRQPEPQTPREADDDRQLLPRPDQHRGDRRLCFDALVHTRHLPYLIEAIQPVPDLVVVIDHLAKPDYSNLDETWARGLRELARRENTLVKISVMATEVSGSA